jgi:[ribosomal protein S5]-alanine N-acetyltransferase
VRVLETRRTRLRPFNMDDLDHAHQQFDMHPDVWRFDPGYPPSRDHRRRWLIYRIQEFQMHGFGCRAIELKATGELIGACGLELGLRKDRRFSKPVLELYYRLGRSYWGQGYATEAVRETIRHAFDDLHVEHLIAHASEDNTASIALLERVGFRMSADPYAQGEVRGVLSSSDERE